MHGLPERSRDHLCPDVGRGDHEFAIRFRVVEYGTAVEDRVNGPDRTVDRGQQGGAERGQHEFVASAFQQFSAEMAAECGRGDTAPTKEWLKRDEKVEIQRPQWA